MGADVPNVPAEPFEWGTQHKQFLQEGPWSLVKEKFETTMTTAKDMFVRLVGTIGSTGYFGNPNNIIEDFPKTDIGN